MKFLEESAVPKLLQKEHIRRLLQNDGSQPGLAGLRHGIVEPEATLFKTVTNKEIPHIPCGEGQPGLGLRQNARKKEQADRGEAAITPSVEARFPAPAESGGNNEMHCRPDAG